MSTRSLAEVVAHPVDHAAAAPACRGHDPELWFVHGLDRSRMQAIRICRACPLLGPCLEHALAYDVDGIWGATTLEERNTYRQQHGLLPRSILGFAPREPTKRQRRQQTPPAAPPEPTKHCPRCETDQPLTRWYPNRATADGLAVWCKSCLHEIAQKGSQ